MTGEMIKKTRSRMEKVVQGFQGNLSSLRTGRAAVSLLDQIVVDYYGTPTPINQVGTLAAPDPTLLTIQPWDVTLLVVIEKAILTSDLGLNPSNDGKIIRIPIPPLTEERRKQLARNVGKILEEHRTSLRNIRRDENEEIKRMFKEKQFSEDDERKLLEEIQKLTDQFVTTVEELANKKREEILTV